MGLNWDSYMVFLLVDGLCIFSTWVEDKLREDMGKDFYDLVLKHGICVMEKERK